MSDQEHLDRQVPDLSGGQWGWLREMAKAWEQLTAEVPASDGPYTVPDFVAWCELEQKGRGYHRDEETEHRADGQRRRRPAGRALAVAG